MHYRQVPAAWGWLRAALEEVILRLRLDHHLKDGRAVIEIIPNGTSKGTALVEFMRRTPYAGRVPIMIGDDRADEDAFAVAAAAGGPGLRVAGNISGRATSRSAMPERCAPSSPLSPQGRSSEMTAETTGATRARRAAPPRMAVIGNSTIAALVDEKARILWTCWPRIDGDPLFSALVGGPDPQRGFLSVELDGMTSSAQSYERNTAILVTVLTASDGSAVRITDLAPRFKQ